MEKYVTFCVHEVEFALPIDHVNYIEHLEDITQIPKTNPFVLGVSHVRGQIIPLIDLKHYLFSQSCRLDSTTRIIGISFNENQLGIVVEEAKEIMDISPDSIQQVSHIDEHHFRVARLENRLILIMEPEELLNNRDIGKILNQLNLEEIKK
ncbi:purine-binding chemotaxis protein CheW [Melghiribacillus thermohalophilus]|uniref:Purine-binding chemotaxis protein CheW n=1 Tax=Melghiribacillus thermohalophilus TaxID=1324956 RepID=A0A4R3MQC5_9BACI|nr:chemotaxis protein CheW [Melghiribacillus thermohalophilus]TCT18083.1 purine-binding chemotaxis protein CheW [Melghiribacillus thermohalophilus]